MKGILGTLLENCRLPLIREVWHNVAVLPVPAARV
jgi:hypothetical protein